MIFVYVQSYRRRGLSVNAEILFYITWSDIWHNFCFLLDFLILIFLLPCISIWFRMHKYFFFFSIHTPRSQKNIGIAKGSRRRLVRYVLSAESYELGSSILIYISIAGMLKCFIGFFCGIPFILKVLIFQYKKNSTNKNISWNFFKIGRRGYYKVMTWNLNKKNLM